MPSAVQIEWFVRLLIYCAEGKTDHLIIFTQVPTPFLSTSTSHARQRKSPAGGRVGKSTIVAQPKAIVRIQIERLWLGQLGPSMGRPTVQQSNGHVSCPGRSYLGRLVPQSGYATASHISCGKPSLVVYFTLPIVLLAFEPVTAT